MYNIFEPNFKPYFIAHAHLKIFCKYKGYSLTRASPKGAPSTERSEEGRSEAKPASPAGAGKKKSQPAGAGFLCLASSRLLSMHSSIPNNRYFYHRHIHNKYNYLLVYYAGNLRKFSLYIVLYLWLANYIHNRTLCALQGMGIL